MLISGFPQMQNILGHGISKYYIKDESHTVSSLVHPWTFYFFPLLSGYIWCTRGFIVTIKYPYTAHWLDLTHYIPHHKPLHALLHEHFILQKDFMLCFFPPLPQLCFICNGFYCYEWKSCIFPFTMSNLCESPSVLVLNLIHAEYFTFFNTIL
jgi:hypothetical protein